MQALQPPQTAIRDSVEPAAPFDATLTSLLVSRPVAPVTMPLPHVVVGDLLALGSSGTALVRYPGQPGCSVLRARTTVTLHATHVGQQVILLFEHGDGARPIVTGVLRSLEAATGDPLSHIDMDIGDERLVVSARSELTLRCGEASITLTKAGKVLIFGTYVSSRSTGVNRIKGGSVQLN